MKTYIRSIDGIIEMKRETVRLWLFRGRSVLFEIIHQADKIPDHVIGYGYREVVLLYFPSLRGFYSYP